MNELPAKLSATTDMSRCCRAHGRSRGVVTSAVAAYAAFTMGLFGASCTFEGRPPAAAGATGGGGGGRTDFDRIDGAHVPTDGGVRAPEPADAVTCVSQSAGATILPVYLAFAFDVSGSMGKGDKPWHDRSLKWDPVTKAAKAFFADPASSGLSASLTFFPSEDDKCEDASYVVPNVAMTRLPATEHALAIDEIGAQSWRGDTPTLHVIRGAIASVEQARQRTPGKYAIVLVTDGYPQGCDDDEIASVAQAVSAVAATIPTYVIGVANPPIDGAPDTVSDLGAIARAGGTGRALLIDTGDPLATAADFKATIDGIRGQTVPCQAPIPAVPSGVTFDKEKVIVRVTAGGAATVLAYDPSCAAAAGWHYDDPAEPRAVVLCPAACGDVQRDPASPGTLTVEFSCSREIIVE